MKELEERVKYYMGKWYDTEITLNKSDFNTYSPGIVSLTQKNEELFEYGKTRSIHMDLHDCLNPDKFYLTVVSDTKLGPAKIKKETRSDSADLPILVKAAWAGEKRIGILLKVGKVRHWNSFMHVEKATPPPWEGKKDKVIWRGAPTGCYTPVRVKTSPVEELGLEDMPRGVFARKYSKEYNIGLVIRKEHLRFGENQEKTLHESWYSLLKGKVSIPEQQNYKYIVSLEGNDVASGLKWQLLSNSVVLMPEPTKISWAMEDTLKPYEHYVPLADSLDNLEEVLQWCRENDSTCKEIAENATQYMQQFLDHDREAAITKELIGRYDKNVSWIKKTPWRIKFSNLFKRNSENKLLCFITHFVGTPSKIAPNNFAPCLQGIIENPDIDFHLITDAEEFTALDPCGEVLYFKDNIPKNLFIEKVPFQKAPGNPIGFFEAYYEDLIDKAKCWTWITPEIIFGNITEYLNSSNEKFCNFVDEEKMPNGIDAENWTSYWDLFELKETNAEIYWFKGKLFADEIEIPWANCKQLGNITANFTWQDNIESFRISKKGYLRVP